MKSLKDIKNSVRKFNVNPRPEMRSRVLDEALEIQRNQKQASTSDTYTWRTIMKSRKTKIATATVIIIAIVVSISYFGSSIDGTAAAWANTLEQIYGANSVTYNKTFEGDKAQPFYFQEMINENGAIRAEIGGTIIIHDLAKGKELQLVPSKKEATLTHYVGRKRAVKPYNKLEWLSSIKDEAGELIGTEDIGGTLTDKFFWQLGKYANVTVWIDPSTDLPVKVREVFIPNPDPNIVPPHFELSLSDFGGADGQMAKMGGSGGRGIQKKKTIIMKDFIWNQQLDPASFSTEPPEDYVFREKQHDVLEIGENGLIKALAFWTEMSGGSFPRKINDLVDPNMINPMLIEKFDGQGDPYDERDEAFKQAAVISKGLVFAQRKKADKNWHYAGDGVYFGDSDAMVCWWKQEDTNDYRVIFGDLSVGILPAEELPK